MNKELEALKESWNHIKDLVIDEYPQSFYEDEVKTIETALKKLEQAENCVFTSKEDVKKKLKAFETIERVLKEYGLQDYLRITENVDDYPNIEDFYELIRYPQNRITSKEQKAFEIIKECEKQISPIINGGYILILIKGKDKFDLLKEVLK